MSISIANTEGKNGFTAGVRQNHSLTASMEGRALGSMAERAPRWVSSDQLTLLGLSAQCAAGACYALASVHREWLLVAIVCLVLNWLGDSLDGTLARVRNQQRQRYGFYVDHVVDMVGSAALMCGMGCSGLIHWQTAMAMLITFLLLAGESYLATYTLGNFELSHGIFGPTEIRILLIIGNVALLRSPYAVLLGHRMLLFDVGGTIASVCMLGLFLRVAARHTAQLYRAEPLP